jgi:hypothetical protein
MQVKSLNNIDQIHIKQGVIVHKISVKRGEIIRVKIGWNGNTSTSKSYGCYSFGKLVIKREEKQKFDKRIQSLLKKAETDKSLVTIYNL